MEATRITTQKVATKEEDIRAKVTMEVTTEATKVAVEAIKVVNQAMEEARVLKTETEELNLTLEASLLKVLS